MVTKELIQYIQSELNSGKTNEQIKEVLIASNWPQADIEGAFLQLQAPIAPSTPATPSFSLPATKLPLVYIGLILMIPYILFNFFTMGFIGTVIFVVILALGIALFLGFAKLFKFQSPIFTKVILLTGVTTAITTIFLLGEKFLGLPSAVTLVGASLLLIGNFIAVKKLFNISWLKTIGFYISYGIVASILSFVAVLVFGGIFLAMLFSGPSNTENNLILDYESTVQDGVENNVASDIVFRDSDGTIITADNIKVWKTINLGTHPDADSLAEEIISKGYEIDLRAKKLIDEGVIPVFGSKTKVGLVKLSFEENMGPAETRSIHKVARDLDLSLCPAETGMQLLLQSNDDDAAYAAIIATEPVTLKDPSKKPFDSRDNIFLVDWEGFFGTQLGTAGGNPDNTIIAADFVFCLE